MSERQRLHFNWEVMSVTTVDGHRQHHRTLVRANCAGHAAQADVPGGSASVTGVRRARNQKQLLWRIHYAKYEQCDGRRVISNQDWFAQVWANTLQQAVEGFLKEYPDYVLLDIGCERW